MSPPASITSPAKDRFPCPEGQDTSDAIWPLGPPL